MMNKNQVKGRMEQTKGTVKEVSGKIVGNKSLESEGLAQKTLGKIQAGVGDTVSALKKKI